MRGRKVAGVHCPRRDVTGELNVQSMMLPIYSETDRHRCAHHVHLVHPCLGV